MLARGHGHFLQILSAAGMLTAPGAAAYAATKHAALGFAEWLAIAHRTCGIGVTVVCPEAVDTKMLADSIANGNAGVRKIAEAGGIVDPTTVAVAAVAGMRANTFLVTTHRNTLANTQRKWADPDRWIAQMASYLASVSR
jgi:short-subunit dehydrogenase